MDYTLGRNTVLITSYWQQPYQNPINDVLILRAEPDFILKVNLKNGIDGDTYFCAYPSYKKITAINYDHY